jgi:hypothetical protein
VLEPTKGSFRPPYVALTSAESAAIPRGHYNMHLASGEKENQRIDRSHYSVLRESECNLVTSQLRTEQN